MSKGSNTTRSGSSSTTASRAVVNGGSVIPSSWKQGEYGTLQTGIEATDSILSPAFMDRLTQASVTTGTYSVGDKRYLLVRPENMTKDVSNYIQTKGKQVAELDNKIKDLEQRSQKIQRALYRTPSRVDPDGAVRRLGALRQQREQLQQQINDILKR